MSQLKRPNRPHPFGETHAINNNTDYNIKVTNTTGDTMATHTKDQILNLFASNPAYVDEAIRLLGPDAGPSPCQRQANHHPPTRAGRWRAAKRRPPRIGDTH